jgi:hypothetical protein
VSSCSLEFINLKISSASYVRIWALGLMWMVWWQTIKWKTKSR